MKICLFCENKYAIDILMPLQEEVWNGGKSETLNLDNSEVLWFVDARKIADFPLKDRVSYTNSIQAVYDFRPDAIFCPGNIIPYYLPGVKIGIFHGYAGKKDQFVIRRYFDTYFTQGPYFTERFVQLQRRYHDFEVLETGWTRQDWVFRHRHDFDGEAAALRRTPSTRILLYAPTFSPSLTSLPYMKESLRHLAETEDVTIIMKFHPLTKQEWIDSYRSLAEEVPNIIWIDDYTVSKYILMCDLMLSDSSSTIYECLLQDKPVITLRSIEERFYWCDIKAPEQLSQAYHEVLSDDHYTDLRQWVIHNYDPYLDGNVARRMLEGAADYIRRHGVPEKRRVNLWRRYASIKAFGRIKR